MKSISKIGFSCIALVVIITIIVFRLFPIKQKTHKMDILKNIDLITGREKIIVDNTIYVGNSKKELENGFYDLKIECLDSVLKLRINLLNKGASKQKYDGEYALEVCNYICNTSPYNMDFELLYKGVVQSYLKLRENYDSKLDSISYTDNKCKVLIYESESELCLELGENISF